jgi:hypothetical protein
MRLSTPIELPLRKPFARRARLLLDYTRTAGRAVLRTAQYDAAERAVCKQVRSPLRRLSLGERSVRPVRTSVLLQDISAAVFSSHHRWRNGHCLHRAVIERLDAVIGRVETERGGPAQLLRASNAHRFLPYYGRLARTAVRKVAGRPAPAIPLDDVTTQGYRRAVRLLRGEGVFDPGSALSGALYDPVALAALLDESERPGFTGWTVLGRIATLELAPRSSGSAPL